MNRHAPARRTGADKKQAAILFIYQATEAAVLAAEAGPLCDRYGVSGREDRREVEAKLLALQSSIRRRQVA